MLNKNRTTPSIDPFSIPYATISPAEGLRLLAERRQSLLQQKGKREHALCKTGAGRAFTTSERAEMRAWQSRLEDPRFRALERNLERQLRFSVH